MLIAIFMLHVGAIEKVLKIVKKKLAQRKTADADRAAQPKSVTSPKIATDQPDGRKAEKVEVQDIPGVRSICPCTLSANLH